ncbi:MAG: hypothetical protein QW292_09290 [Candidatus Parvarchaeota archaeon]
MIPGFDPSKFIEKEFSIQRISWNLYDVDLNYLKGTIRVLTIPVSVLEIPTEVPNQQTTNRQYAFLFQTVVGFVNRGMKHQSDPTPFDINKVDENDKVDITNDLVTSDEPFSEFLLAGTPKTILRMKTTLLKAELIKNRFNILGDPIIWVQTNTSYSTTVIKGQGYSIK